MLTTYQRNGKVAYLDPIRAFLVEAKPEEAVRQQLLHRLIHEYNIPQDLIAVEFPLKKTRGTSRWRADIVVSSACGRPLLVIECKAPDTPLHDGVLAQAERYAEELDCPYLAIANGGEPEAFHRHEGLLWRLARLPGLDEMLDGVGLEYVDPVPRDFAPFTIDELEDHDFLRSHDELLDAQWRYLVLGQDTEPALWTPIYTLYTAIFHQPDTASSLPLEAGAFRLEEYLGLHFTEYGNYSGGKFPGLYASYRVTDAKDDDQIFKIAFSSTAHTENHPTFGNRRGTSGIHVAIDDFDNAPHMSLELSLDTCLVNHACGFDVIHDGKITVGRLGAARRDILLEFVAERAPYLIHGGRVHLGSFPSGRALAFDDVAEFVFNLLLYADIRDQFREAYRREREG